MCSKPESWSRTRTNFRSSRADGGFTGVSTDLNKRAITVNDWINLASNNIDHKCFGVLSAFLTARISRLAALRVSFHRRKE